MPWGLLTLGLAAIVLSSFGKAKNIAPDDPTQHGITIFYKIEPSQTQIANFSVGDFKTPPLNPYECGPDPAYPFQEPSFGCNNLALETASPLEIYHYRHPNPQCLSSGIAFEHFQWATWTHACWEHPQPAIDTPSGHAEAAFQSNAIAFRQLVLYQHDMHVLALNRKIEDLRLPKDTEQEIRIAERDKRLAAIDNWADDEIGKLPEHGGDHRARWLEFERRRKEKKEDVNRDWKIANDGRESQFWRDSWPFRLKVMELDHLIGEYFERWMGGRTQGGWDWAGMGEPEPAWPPNMIMPL